MITVDKNDARWVRILGILNPDIFRDVKVTVVGLGSGGGNTVVQLVKSGVASYNLIDPDTLGVENVIRHICGHSDVGRLKVEAVKDKILDINPDATVETFPVDAMDDIDLLRKLIRESNLVIGAADKLYVNYLLNQVCVEEKVPAVFGKVFKKGIGGEVYRYIPEKTGCLACLEGFLQSTGILQGAAPEDDLNDEDWEEIYGSTEVELKTSPGLSIDIEFITLFHARLALDTLLQGKDSSLPPIKANYIVWSNRPEPPFDSHFSREFYLVHPQESCLICREIGGPGE